MVERKPARRMMPIESKGGGVVRFMAAASGYAMVRRKGCTPFVVSIGDWNSWQDVDYD